jgi:DNA-binding transcriptional LysR family regulator
VRPSLVVGRRELIARDDSGRVRSLCMSLSTFDLNLLSVLDAVLTEGGVAKAAHRLHVTPSAVSNSLARLRLLVGDKLVTKKGRGVVPTPRALELAPVLAKSLRDLHDAVHAGRFDPAATTRRFTIALSDVGQVVLLPRIAALFAQEMPLAKLRAVGIDALPLLGGLAGPEVDVVIGPEEPSADMKSEPLFQQPAVLICRKTHPALKKPASKSNSVLRHVAVEMAPGQRLRDVAATAYAKAGVVRHIAMSVPTFSAAAAVVAATDLVATVPASLLEALRGQLDLRTLPFPIPTMMIATNLCWHTRTHADAAAAGFRDILRRAVAIARARPSRALNDVTRAKGR